MAPYIAPILPAFLSARAPKALHNALCVWYTLAMTTKRIVRISYFTMLTVIGGLIRLPLPFTPIRFTLQSLFVAAAGLVLGGKDGAVSQIAYMLLGLMGLPVFSEGGGIDYVLRPSFGYIPGFVLQAFLTGHLVSKQKTLSSGKLFLCALAGVLAGYTVGIAYQVAIVAFYIGNGMAAAIAGVPSVLVMLVKDVVLIYLLCLLYPRIRSLIGKVNETAKKADDGQLLPPPADPKTEEGEKGTKDPEPNKAPVPEPAATATKPLSAERKHLFE